MTKEKDRRFKPHPKLGLIQARVSNKDFQEIFTKAQLYAKGNVGEYVRMACLNYRPIKRVKVGK